MNPPPAKPDALAIRLLAALPQTQCTRCGYPDCAAYAQAIAAGAAPINRCPPGGAEGVARLAALTGQPVLPLDPEHGTEGPRGVAWIDEDWCIGCTLCIAACPVDCIIGGNKRMHTVIEAECTGCELCVPACPVDCIHMEAVSGSLTGWAAWSAAEAEAARESREGIRRCEGSLIGPRPATPVVSDQTLFHLRSNPVSSESAPQNQERITFPVAASTLPPTVSAP